MLELQFTKVCFKCGEQKEKKEFYKHKGTKDGLLGKCIKCAKIDAKKYLLIKISTHDGLEKERSRHREKYYRLGYKEKHKPSTEAKKLTMDRYKLKYPEKYKAKNISQRIKLKTKGNHLHHWNYNFEFAKDVIELNPKDHLKIHRFIKYDKKTFMYKDLNGLLLDTKQKHLDYIQKILLNF
jgi:hypothetical protein